MFQKRFSEALSLSLSLLQPHFPDFGSIHFIKNIEDYLLKLMCCAYLPWQLKVERKIDEN
jgi:hypothetical protein